MVRRNELFLCLFFSPVQHDLFVLFSCTLALSSVRSNESSEMFISTWVYKHFVSLCLFYRHSNVNDFRLTMPRAGRNEVEFEKDLLLRGFSRCLLCLASCGRSNRCRWKRLRLWCRWSTNSISDNRWSFIIVKTIVTNEKKWNIWWRGWRTERRWRRTELWRWTKSIYESRFRKEISSRINSKSNWLILALLQERFILVKTRSTSCSLCSTEIQR